jgi:hypothetical protein
MSPSPPKHRRWRLVADPRIQGELLIRLAFYWGIFQFVQLGTIAIFAFLEGGSGTQGGMRFLMPSVIVSALFLPVVMLDSLRFSNRFVGPVVNLKNKLAKLSQGDPGEPVHFRKGDHWKDMAESYNLVREQCLKQEQPEDSPVNASTDQRWKEQVHV